MERLEIIKGKVARSLNEHGTAILDWSDSEWLIKQAEKAERYEKALKDIAERDGVQLISEEVFVNE